LELYLCEFALQGVLVDDLNKQRVNGRLEMGLLQQLLAFHAACNSSALVVSTAHLLILFLSLSGLPNSIIASVKAN
jgi:hypothetical protein